MIQNIREIIKQYQLEESNRYSQHQSKSAHKQNQISKDVKERLKKRIRNNTRRQSIENDTNNTYQCIVDVNKQQPQYQSLNIFKNDKKQQNLKTIKDSYMDQNKSSKHFSYFKYFKLRKQHNSLEQCQYTEQYRGKNKTLLSKSKEYLNNQLSQFKSNQNNNSLSREKIDLINSNMQNQSIIGSQNIDQSRKTTNHSIRTENNSVYISQGANRIQLPTINQANRIEIVSRDFFKKMKPFKQKSNSSNLTKSSNQISYFQKFQEVNDINAQIYSQEIQINQPYQDVNSQNYNQNDFQGMNVQSNHIQKQHQSQVLDKEKFNIYKESNK